MPRKSALFALPLLLALHSAAPAAGPAAATDPAAIASAARECSSCHVLDNPRDPANIEAVRAKVHALTARFPVYG